MDTHYQNDYPHRRTSLAHAAAVAAARLQTPSLTSLTSTTSRTSTTSMLTSGGGAHSSLGHTTIVAGHSTPPLIDLDDAETYRGGPADAGGFGGVGGLAPPKRPPLAFEAGAGVTPTDKLKALLRQMEGEVRAAKPEPNLHQTTQSLPPAGALAPPNTLRRSGRQPPHATSPPRDQDTGDDYSPPTPPPRLSNTYMYSRRSMERRVSDERESRSPSPPRRLPSRAIALRAAAQVASTVAPQPSPQREQRPTPLQSFIASHPESFPESSSSRTRLEATPRPPSPSSRKGKERAEYLDSRQPLPPSNPVDAEEEQSIDEYEDDDYYPEYDEPSPPRRRGLTHRSLVVEAPPDTSAAFAAGLDAAGDEYDLEDDSALPWREEDTADSLDSGSGRRQRFLAAEERSHSRSREHMAAPPSAHTSGSMSFATAPSIRPRPSVPADISLPPIPDPESSDEEDARAIRRREQLLRPFSSREAAEFPRHSLAQAKATTTYHDTRSRTSPEPEEPSRYDTARDSARFDALLHGNITSSSRTPARDRNLDRHIPRDRDSPSSVYSKDSLREIATSSIKEQGDYHDNDHRGQSESPLKATPPKEMHEVQKDSRDLYRRSASPKYGRQASQSPALDDSDTLPTPDTSRQRQPPPGRNSLRSSASPRQSLLRSNIRWSPEVDTRAAVVESFDEDEESWSPDAQVQSTPARPRWSPEVERRELERTVSREEHVSPPRAARETTPPRTAAHVPSTSPQSTPPPSVLTPTAQARPAPAPAPETPLPAVPATPAHLHGMKTPRPPGAWGTPIPPKPAMPVPARDEDPAPVTPAAAGPSTPAHLKEMKTPRPPGAWGTPIPSKAPAPKPAAPKTAMPRPPALAPISGLPSTPTPAPNRTLNGLPTPRPPGAWYNSPAGQAQRNVPTRFSSLRNEVLPDSSVSSAGSASTGDVSFHRLRSPKRSPPKFKKELVVPPTADQGLRVPTVRSPLRSPVWSSPVRRVSPGIPPPSPVTPTKSPSSQVADESFSGPDPDASWAARLHRVVMSPIRRPPPSTAVADAQQALDAASKASAVARSKVEDAQRAWLDALASVPDEPPSRVVQAAKKGWTWGRILLLAALEVLLLWFVFRVTLDYATSGRLLAALDPWHPQLTSYALNIPVPAGLQAFAARPAAPTNLFDLLDLLGITGRPGKAGVIRTPT